MTGAIFFLFFFLLVLLYIYIYIFFFFFFLYYNILPLSIVGVYNRYHRDIHIFVQKSGGTEINEWPKAGICMFYS